MGAPFRPSQESLAPQLYRAGLGLSSCPVLILHPARPDLNSNLSCCIPEGEDIPSLAVTAVPSPSQSSFGEQSTKFAKHWRPQVPLVAAQCKSNVPWRGVAVPKDPWPLLCRETGPSAGALADHCGKPGMKMQLRLFNAQMKCKTREV